MYCKMIGDSNPDFYNASRQLSFRSCLQFNKQYPFSLKYLFPKLCLGHEKLAE